MKNCNDPIKIITFQLIFIFKLAFIPVFSQVQFSKYLNSTSEWNFTMESYGFSTFCNDDANKYVFIRWYFDGDTIIDSKPFYKLYEIRRDSLVCPDLTYTIVNYSFLTGFLMEDSLSKIYHNTSDEAGLIWDFNISVGDTVKKKCIISWIDTVWLGNLPLKRFHCSCPDSSFIIEGIGSNNGFEGSYLCATGIESNTHLICYKRDNFIVQVDTSLQCGLLTGLNKSIRNTASDLFSIILFPNPATDQMQITLTLLEKTDLSLSLFSINGEKIKDVIHNKEISSEGFSFVINLKSISSGFYILKIENGKSIRHLKLLKLNND